MNIKTVTILGANGTMGKNISAIFASFGQAKVYLACRTIEKANKAVIDAYNSVKAESIIDRLIPITYDNMEEAIKESDLVLESITEDFDIKINMYNKIKPFLKEQTIVATGTSGLSIKKLSKAFEEKSENFFGIHMFNPPYNLTLCELIIHDENQKKLAKELKEYLQINLNRTVVEVRDEPGFLGNRIGFYFINEALKLAYENMDQGGIDYIDTILGCFTGRNMPPIYTADFVGLDTTKAIIDYVYENINDIFKCSFKLPEYINSLISNGAIGKKVGKGLFYKNIDNNINYVYDIKLGIYRPVNNYQFYFSNEMIKNIKCGNYDIAIKILIDDESHEAIICKTMILKYIIYSLYTSKNISYDIYSCDDAMATGFSWLPPMAWINLLGGTSKVKELSKRYLEKEYIEFIEKSNILEEIENKSDYDYRPFMKAKY